MKIRQHIPNFIDVYQRQDSIDFSNYEELIEIPFVKQWMKVMDNNAFIRLSIASNYGDNHSLLMGEWENKSKWVIGYIDQTTVDWLPEWEKESPAPES